MTRGPALTIDHVTGTFDGPTLSGEVTWGLDQLQSFPDGCFRPNAILHLRPREGGDLLMRYRGIAVIAPEWLPRLAASEIPSGPYYHRIAVEFETTEPRWSWLNRVIGVGTGHLIRQSERALGVHYAVGVIR